MKTPEQAAEAMRQIFGTGNFMNRDEAKTHPEADELLCELLEDLGYNEAVAVFRDAPKWYE